MDALRIDIETKILKATFAKNMMLFEKKAPHVYEYFKDYKPKKNRIGFDESGLNIVVDGAYMYPEGDKQEFIQQQVDLFYDDPKKMFYLPNYKENDIEMFIHGQRISEICELREEIQGNFIPNPLKENALYPDFINCIVFAGVGLGFHIEKIAQQKNLNYIFIYEPDMDVFYASLHSMDWAPIFANCLAEGSVYFTVGYDKQRFLNELKSMTQKIGAFNVSQLFIYQHYNSEVLDDSVKMFFEIGYRLSSGWGFCEDEVIGIAHTLHNLDSKTPVLKNNVGENPAKDLPVFVVGNGPSLDDDLEFIKKHQGSAMIVSCGTSIYPLLKNGIKPDCHIEIERTYGTYTALKGLDMDEQLAEIKIVALNTVPPEVFNLFKKGYMVIKASDAGADLIHKHISVDDYPALQRCNPTCTNLGVELMLELKFKDVYLFGLDFGWLDGAHHHSKSSKYYEEDIPQSIKSSNLYLPGNFEDKVSTDFGLDMSRAVVEMSVQKHNTSRVFNCSNGLLIGGAEPLHSYDITGIIKEVDKTKIISQMFDYGFSNDMFIDIDFKEEFEKEIAFIKRAFLNIKAFLDKDVASIPALHLVFAQQVKYVLDFDDFDELTLPKRFIAGTLTYFQSTIISNSYFFTDKEKLTEYIHACFAIFEAHMDELIDIIENCYATVDKREDYRIY
jgi:hypothetical protein